MKNWKKKVVQLLKEGKTKEADAILNQVDKNWKSVEISGLK